jgi:PAS domain S-box-containing protein
LILSIEVLLLHKRSILKISNNKLFFGGISLALLIFVAMVFFSYRQANQAVVSASWVAHTQEVLFHTEKLSLAATNLETGARAYLLTGLQRFLDLSGKSKSDIRGEISLLRQLTSDNPSQQSRIDSLQRYVMERIAFSDSILMQKKGMSNQAALEIVSNGKEKLYMDHIGALIGQMQDEENRLLTIRKSDNTKAISVQHRVFIYFVFFMLVLLVFIFWNEKLGSEQREKEKSGRMFRDLLESAPDAMVIVNEKGLIVLTNQQTESLFGYQKSELIGQPVELLIPEELRLNHIYHREQFGKDPRVRSMGAGMELMAVKKNGAKFPVEISLSPLQREEGVLISASIRDITERKSSADRLKRSEEGFRLLVSNVKDYAIFMVDVNGLVASWNSGAEYIKGYHSEEIIGQPIGVFYTERDQKLGEPGHNLEMARKYGHYEKEGWKVRKDGSMFFADVVITALFDEKGNLKGYSKVTRDITEQKKAQEQLQRYSEELEEKVLARTEQIYKNEARFRTLVENSYDIISLLDESLKVVYRSPSATRILGWTDEEMEDLDGYDNIHPDDRKKMEGVVDECLANPGKPMKALFRRLHKQGHYVTLKGVITNLLDDQRVKAIVANYRDETQRIEAEEKLNSSEMWFRSLIENSAEAISVSDEYSNNIYRSPAAVKIMGNLPKEKATSLAHPDYLEEFNYKRAEAIEKPGIPIAFQGRFLHGSGLCIWLEGTFTNLLNVKGVNAVVTNYRDITQRKKAEEKLIQSEKIYKTIASSIPGTVICLLDQDYRYLLIEGDMLEKLGYSKEKLLGNKAEDVLPPEFFEGIRSELERAFGGETVSWETIRNGYDTVSRFIPLKDENNVVSAIMSVSIDVTELKDAHRDINELNRDLEEKIVRRTEQLRKSNEELEAFSYSISHDLRAPLRGIIGFSSILAEEYGNKLDNEAKRIISVIRSSVERMGQLIDDLLNFSRMGRQEINKTSIQTNDMVGEVIKELTLPGTGNTIEWVIHSLPDSNVDVNTIKQVWVNLISNAMKYSKKTKDPKIEIGSFMDNGQTGYFVKDNGAGFNEKYMSKLFKVFQRLHSSREYEGTGVGLAIVEKIISKHGGRVWAEAEVNKGAVFYFSLPM